MPPRVVLARSLGAGAQTSPNSSQVRLPANAHGADCQKLYPLVRAELKYIAPWYGCENWLLRKALLSHCQGSVRLLPQLSRENFAHSCPLDRLTRLGMMFTAMTSATATQKCFFWGHTAGRGAYRRRTGPPESREARRESKVRACGERPIDDRSVGQREGLRTLCHRGGGKRQPCHRTRGETGNSFDGNGIPGLRTERAEYCVRS